MDNFKLSLDSTEQTMAMNSNMQDPTEEGGHRSNRGGTSYRKHQKHRRNLSVQTYSLAEKHSKVIQWFEYKMNLPEPEITPEEYENYCQQIESKSYRDNLFNDFDFLLTMELLWLLYPKESKAKHQDRWV